VSSPASSRGEGAIEEGDPILGSFNVGNMLGANLARGLSDAGLIPKQDYLHVPA
jgi:hypothetical protein